MQVTLTTAPDFDEAWYLERYPDVARAVQAGTIKSGRHHYTSRGRREGRSGGPAATVSDTDKALQAGFDALAAGSYREAIQTFEDIAAKSKAGRAYRLAARGRSAAVWLRGFEPRKAEVYARLDALRQETAPLSFESRIGTAFKWNMNPLSISSVFMGTSDGGLRPIQRPLFQQLQGLVEQGMEFELISLIGGMYFLELVADFPFQRIRLFDSNLAEHTKWSFIYKYLMKTPFEQFEQFRDLDKYFEDHPDVVYLPQLGLGGHSLSFTNDAHFDFNDMRTRSTSLLSPIYYVDFAWSPERDRYEKTVARLRTAMEPQLTFDIPEVDAKGRALVVFLSNASIPVEVLRKYIRNCPLLIPLYSHEKNNEVLDAHRYWVLIASGLVHKPALHVWSPEDAALAGTDLDYPCTRGIVSTDLVAASGPLPYESALLHILFGKRAETETLDNRRALFRASLRRLSTTVSRVVVAEYNRNCPAFANMTELPRPNELIALIQEELPGFRFNTMRFAPGGGEPHRNVFICFDKGKP